ncbi:MAG: 2-succinyl-6-hydroxy-2,4-cyclohexadiene-1-carboxylate synthase [Candidatus Promineifilaceae bacterium]
MARITINNLEYNFHRQGKGSPLVLLHGFTGCGQSWKNLDDSISSQVRCITLDLPGHGQTESSSKPERYAIERTAEDVIALADELDLERFSLLGYSMGGRLALYLAIHYPERINALILESASPGIADLDERKKRQEWDYALAERIESEGIRSFVDWWEKLPLFASQTAVLEERRARLRQERLNNNISGLANSLRGMGTGSQPSLWSKLPDLELPTMLLCGELEEKYVRINREMAKAIPNSKLVIFQDAGHNIHFEQPEAFAETLSHYLRRI